jgi:hypothetical protein
VDEKERLKAQIKAYEYYAGLIERAVGGGAQPKLPRWDEQRAQEYRDLVVQLKQRLAELEAQDAAKAASAPTEPENAQQNGQPITVSSGDGNATSHN